MYDAWQVLKEEAAALEEQAPKLAAKAVELTKQLQKEEEVCSILQYCVHNIVCKVLCPAQDALSCSTFLPCNTEGMSFYKSPHQAHQTHQRNKGKNLSFTVPANEAL